MTSTRLTMEPYLAQRARWPRTRRHVMAQFDDESVVVYQAYRPAIGQFAAAHGYFERRAVQLGLRGDTLRRYAKEWILAIEDVTPMCHEQHARWRDGGDAALVMPREDAYPLTAAAVATLGTGDE